MNSFLDFSFDPAKAVALIPTLMSVVCSANVARLVKKSHVFSSQAKRILFSLSIYELLSTLAFSIQSLFIPRLYSHFLWAIGNRSILGLMMQFSISSYIFSCTMSLIYLGKIRTRMNNQQNKNNREFVAQRIEPWTGALGVCYILTTILIGLGMKYYSHLEFFKIDEVTQPIFQDLSSKLGFALFPGYPITNLVAAITFNSLIMHTFVKAGTKRYTHSDPSSRQQAANNGMATAAVLLTFLWTAVLRVFESNDIWRTNNEAGLMPLLLLQAFFVPMLGLYSVLTWMKPQYQRVKALYPMESNIWCISRTLLGDKLVRPTEGWNNQQQQPNTSPRRRRRSNSAVEADEFDYASRKNCRF